MDDSFSSNEDEFKDYYQNPLRRKMYDSMKLQQQQKEIFRMAEFKKNEEMQAAITARIEKNHKEMVKQNRNYASVSLCGCTVTNPIREFVIKIVVFPWFDRFILLTILANSVVLALEDPFEKNELIENLDYIFLSIFSIEMILKVIAMGFIMRPYSYLRDAWNVLDCVVVALGWIGLVFAGANVNAIRAIRILRPLRGLHSMPGMAGLVKTLLNSLPQMVNIMILFVAFLVITATVGVQLFAGDFLNRCALTSSIPKEYFEGGSISNNNLYGRILDPEMFSPDEGFNQRILNIPSKRPTNVNKTESEIHFKTYPNGISLVQNADLQEIYCTSDDQCPTDTMCVFWGNPNYGLSNWDNILFGILMTFEIIGLEGWSDNMYQVRVKTGNCSFDIYFLMTVIFGSFFVMNLLIAVQFDFLQRAFTEIDEEKAAKKIRDKEEEEENLKKGINTKKKSCFKKTLEFTRLDSCFKRLFAWEPPRAYRDFQKKKMAPFVEHTYFQYACLIIILLNTVTLASEHYEQPDWLEGAQTLTNNIFSVLFITESIMRFIAMGLKEFFKDGFNIFDTFVNFFSIMDFFQIGPSFVVLRGFRLLRIFKVVRQLTGLRNLLETVLKSLDAIFNLGILIFMFVFIYALLGKSFFYEQMTDADGSVSRYQFDNVGDSLMLIFIILSSEDWNRIMRIVVNSHGYFGVVFCTSAMVIGNFMLLNLFLAILLKYIDDKEVEVKNEIKEKKYEIKDVDEDDSNESDEESEEDDDEDEEDDEDEQSHSLSGSEESEKTKPKIRKTKSTKTEDNNNKPPSLEIPKNDEKAKSVKLSSPLPLRTKQTVKENINSSEGESVQNTNKRQEGQQKIQVQGKACFIVAPDSPPRVFLAYILNHPYFETYIFHFIFLNSLLLVLDEPILTDKYTKSSIELMSEILSLIFLIECCMKIFVMGFYFGPTAYLKEGFNVLDFSIVMVSIVDFILSTFETNVDISYLRAFRALRALRPLKLVSKNQGMRLIVNSLLNSISGISNVMVISILFYTVYGILGVQFLSGRIASCSNPDFTTKQECLENNFKWILPPEHYDNFFNSMLTFYEVSTLEMWPDIMYTAIDSANEVDNARVPYNRPYISLIFVTFIFITTFFVMNLFISVIVNKFQEEKEKTEGVADLKDEQKEWVKIQRYLAEVVVPVIPVEPEGKCRKFTFNLCQSYFFEGIVQTVIVLNTITMVIVHHGSSETFDFTLSVFNSIFVAFFIIEAALKLLGYGFQYYFSQSENIFDFVLVFLSIVAIDDRISEYLHFNMTVFRIIRVARLLRMIKASKQLQALLKTLYLAMQNIFNVGLLFFLIIFTFAIAAMNLFGEIKRGELGYINSQANFRTFYHSMMTLFRASTGESWNGIMHDCEEAGIMGYIFWVFFMLISMFIFVNVFIAVIYEEFKNVQHSNDTTDVLSLKRRDISNFLNAWADVNPQGQHFMKTEKLTTFLRNLPPPLGFKGQKLEGTKLLKIIYCLNIRDHQGYVYFPEVMWAVFYSVIGNNDRGLSNCVQMKQIMSKVKHKYKGLDKDVTLNSLCGNKYWHNEITVTKYLCGITILNNMKVLMQRKRDREQQLLSDQNLASNRSGRSSQQGDDYAPKDSRCKIWCNSNYALTKQLWRAVMYKQPLKQKEMKKKQEENKEKKKQKESKERKTSKKEKEKSQKDLTMHKLSQRRQTGRSARFKMDNDGNDKDTSRTNEHSKSLKFDSTQSKLLVGNSILKDDVADPSQVQIQIEPEQNLIRQQTKGSDISGPKKSILKQKNNNEMEEDRPKNKKKERRQTGYKKKT